MFDGLDCAGRGLVHFRANRCHSWTSLFDSIDHILQSHKAATFHPSNESPYTLSLGTYKTFTGKIFLR